MRPVALPADSRAPSTEEPSIEEMIAEAASWLPQQAPLHAFVHHNPLHHLEHLCFEEAVLEGSRVLGNQAFQTEAAFAEHLRTGRIGLRDIEAVVDARTPDPETGILPGGPSLRKFRVFRLRHLFEIPSGATLRWTLCEGGAAARLHPDVGPERRRAILEEGSEVSQLAALWSRLEAAASESERASASELVGIRPRDRVRARTGIDPDEWVHPLLIRLSAAFLDQGMAYWAMPDRDRGFLSAVRRLYGRRLGPPLRWARGLAPLLAAQEREGVSAEETIVWALDAMGVREADRGEVIRETLLSLRGWAGMMRQFERRPALAPVLCPPSSLTAYLAVQLLLDLVAARAALRDAGETDALPLPSLGDRGCEGSPRAEPDRSLVYEAFVLAQLSDLPLARFGEAYVAEGWLQAVSDFDEIERRLILHLAYERHHRDEVLAGLAARSAVGLASPSSIAFQAIFCIDDREESLRRHLEEIEPRVETFGYAGFFGVAMDYRGLDDVRFRPLCPVVIEPGHAIREIPASPSERDDYARARGWRGWARRAALVATSRTLVRGSLVTAILGPLSTIPLVGRTLFPRLAHALSHRLEGIGLQRPRTRLAIERAEESVELAGDDFSRAVRSGYTVAEMVEIVASALGTMGLDPTASPLVLVVGHGSSSLNNPHEAAHDCGATGGGRGGPNARAFAAMANHDRVRQRLRERGLGVPDETWFVGAYHNTCDDSVGYYDEDLVPEVARGSLDCAKRALAEACVRDAHERCRRFESAPAGISLTRALEEAQEHAVDLAQPRPEYGHATNSVCIVGRRSRTRGLFLDRRAFLVSYDPTIDRDGQLLARLLLSVGPVGAGINLEYYFSTVDPTGYGCGTKLPHNIVGLIGVMDGHASDLRTGLPWQMVEIHEPVRLLTIVEARPDRLGKILEQEKALAELIGHGWIQLVCWDPDSGELFVLEGGRFRRHHPGKMHRSVAPTSVDYYRGHADPLAPALVGLGGAA